MAIRRTVLVPARAQQATLAVQEKRTPYQYSVSFFLFLCQGDYRTSRLELDRAIILCHLVLVRSIYNIAQIC